MARGSGKGVPAEVWERLDVAGPTALARETGIRQQYASGLMRGKEPSAEELLRPLAAYGKRITLADLVPNGRAIQRSIEDGNPIPMASVARASPSPRRQRGTRGTGRAEESDRGSP